MRAMRCMLYLNALVFNNFKGEVPKNWVKQTLSFLWKFDLTVPLGVWVDFSLRKKPDG